MSYNKKTWVSNEIITKDALNNIENGIASKPDFSIYQDYTILNVKELGAKGDGVTNDAPILRDIFANAPDYSVIYFPNGNYILGDGTDTEILLSLRYKKYIHIIGQSQLDTIITAFPQQPVKKEMGLIALFRCEYCSVQTIQLDGNSQARHVANGGENWGDTATEVYLCSNINVKGANHTLIKDVYSHHPVVDCIETTRYAGGDTPANEYITIDNCNLDYGYRQGLSIAGTAHGVIKNTRITNVSMAPDLFRNDGTSVIGTPPRAGIDSETWVWNHNWTIENCYFENNRMGHINMNDGASEHLIKDCYFVGGTAITCETPSAGGRTLNNIIINNHFINSGMLSLNGAFSIINNSFYYDDITTIGNNIRLLLNNEAPFDRNSKIVFEQNRMVVRLDLFEKAGVDLSTLTFGFYLGNHVIMKNNIFHNLIGTGNFLNMGNSTDMILTDNVFTCSTDLTDVMSEASIVRPKGAKFENNYVDSKYPLSLRAVLNNRTSNSRYYKDGSKYYATNTISMNNGRKNFVPIIKFDDLKSISGKLKITSNREAKSGFTLPSPINVEYDFTLYKKGTELVQKGKFTNIFDCESALVSCDGFVLKDDGIVYMTLLNEYTTSQFDATFDIEIYDTTNAVMPTLNFADVTQYEKITSPLPLKVEARAYELGEQVRSDSSNGSMYLFEVTTAGTVVTPQKLNTTKSKTMDGVVFTYKGYYGGSSTFGKEQQQ